MNRVSEETTGFPGKIWFSDKQRITLSCKYIPELVTGQHASQAPICWSHACLGAGMGLGVHPASSATRVLSGVFLSFLLFKTLFSFKDFIYLF